MSDITDKALERLVKEHDASVHATLRKMTHPQVYKKAIKLSGNNVHRLTIESDGSIIVWNKAVW